MTDDLHPAEAAYMAAIRAGTDWYAAADKAVATLAKSRQPFTADDVRAACGMEPENPNSWGGFVPLLAWPWAYPPNWVYELT
ncbi:hypothetical protein QP916_02800 [Corynebacterium accolens]|uniref:hypothetical protein n=1 Tax=Corynebacterium accolens TaxID=38284 RepID=UPI00254E7A26|nr:hypothetical protein [Corynebacterium accolens]MDK8497595.1 hypothetical protein [Corynebacterium accolens]